MDDLSNELAIELFGLGCAMNLAMADTYRDGHEDARQAAEAHELERQEMVIDALLRCRKSGAWDEDLDVIAKAAE